MSTWAWRILCGPGAVALPFATGDSPAGRPRALFSIVARSRRPAAAAAMLRLRNRLLPLLRAGTQLPSPIHNGGSRLLLSTSTTPFSLEDYLVASCGLAPAQARSTSKKALDEASRASVMAFHELSSARHYPGFDPDAVLALFSRIGLSRADIADVVAADPLILRSRVGILEPRLLGLRDSVGLSLPQIARLLVVNSRVIRAYRDLGPNIRFFLSFYGLFEKLMVLSKGNKNLVTVNIDRVVKPNIALLRQCGLRAPDIARLSSTCPRILTSNPERVKEFVLRAEELGVPRSSRMFQYAVSAVGNTTKESNAVKLEFLKITLGCSKSEVATAVSKMPTILGMSDENLLRKIQFMIKEVGLEPQYILQRPVLLALSLEKRLVPRYHVIKVLLAKGFLESKFSFSTIFKMGEKTFRSKFIDCHKDSVNGLEDAYAAARGGSVPTGDKL